MNNYMASGYGGYNGSNPPVDQYRNQNVSNGSPVQHPGAPAANFGAPPPGFGMPMGMGGYGYGGNVPYMQEQPASNNRRGRVGQPHQRKKSPRP